MFPYHHNPELLIRLAMGLFSDSFKKPAEELAALEDPNVISITPDEVKVSMQDLALEWEKADEPSNLIQEPGSGE